MREYRPPYYILYMDQEGMHRASWEARTRAPHNGPGVPTPEKLEEWRVAMNQSFQPGGENEHVRLSNGAIPHIHTVIAMDTMTRKEVYRTKMPKFEVI